MKERRVKDMFFLLLLLMVVSGCRTKEEARPDVSDDVVIDQIGQDQDTSFKTTIPDFTGHEDGTYAGTLFVEELDIMVPLYLADINGDQETIQAYANDKDSAVLFKYGAQYVAADHVEQAFSRLGEAVPGTTKAEVEWLDGSKSSYICTRSCLGLNNGYLYDDTGRMITDVNTGGITTYTCTDTWQTVTMVFWQPDETAA